MTEQEIIDAVRDHVQYETEVLILEAHKAAITLLAGESLTRARQWGER
jgi:hypothetical protein